MPPVKGFVGGSYVGQSDLGAGERCINLFPEAIPHGDKVPSALYPAPGVELFATLPKVPGRGIFSEAGRLWAVSGDMLSEIDANGTVTDRGTVLVDGNPVTMSTNGDGGNELFVTSGFRGDILETDTNNFFPGEVDDVTFGGHVDGFFTGLDAETSTLKISENLDGQTWDGTQIVQRASASDPWRAKIVIRREIILIGEKTGEVYFNAGRSPFPFIQRPGTFFEVGIIAAFSLAKFNGSCAWLGRNAEGFGAVYWLNGYTPEEISDPGIRWVIQKYQDQGGNIADAIGWSYEREGHVFYVLNFLDVNRTWVFDATTRSWHERGYWDPNANDYLVYRPQYHAVAFGRNLVLDNSGDKIWSFNSEVFVDVDGQGIRRERIFRGRTNGGKYVTTRAAELECETGVGLAVASDATGYDPVVNLRSSKNGGKTWGDSRPRSIGKRGEYDKRVRWNSCGQARDRKWSVWSSDPVAQRWFSFSEY